MELTNNSHAVNTFLQNGGEMGELTRQFHWEQTALGHIEQWPKSLLSLVSIILSSKYPMFLWWGKDLIQFYNDAYRPSLGMNGKHPAALGQKGEDCWPEIWPVVSPLIKKVLAGGSTWSEDELIPIYRNGRMEDVYWTFSYSPARDDSGAIRGVLVVCNETTDKIITLRKLVESENSFRTMILQAPVAICIFRGPTFLVEVANEKMLELWGRSADEVIGKPVFEGVPAASNQGFEELIGNVYTTGKTLSASGLPINLFRKGKMEKVYVNFVYQPLREAGGNISGVLAVASEITEEVEIHHKIELAEERARLAIEASRIGTYDLNLTTGELITSKRFDDIFGFSEPQSNATYLASIHPDDSEIREKAYEKLQETGRLLFEFRIIKKDKSLAWIRSEGILYKKAGEKSGRLIGTLMDITESKYLIKQKDDFISVASHELKTPVTIIMAYTQVLEMALMQKSYQQELSLVEKVNKQLDKLNALINNLLDTTKMISGHLELSNADFDFNELIKETINDIQLTISKKITLKIEAPECRVFADRDKIEQTISNLVSNAIKFSPESDSIIVKTYKREAEIFCEIQDFGIGIKEENQKRIFEQFYRTDDDLKYTFPGIGLGLYFSSEIIKRQGGNIWVKSKAGEGSIFTFSLPCI